MSRNCRHSRYRLLSACITAILLILCHPTWAQEKEPQPDVSMRELLEAEDEAKKLIDEIEETDATGIKAESTPLKALAGMMRAGDAQDFEGAAQYLDMRYLPEEMEDYTAEGLIKALSYVFSRQNIISLSTLSDSPEGTLNDGLPVYRDKIGEIRLMDEVVPIFLQRVPDGNGRKTWKISNATVEKIPQMWDELGYSPIAIYLSKVLPQGSFMGMQNWQLLGTVIFIIIAWPLATVVSSMLLRLLLLLPNNFPIATSNLFNGAIRFFLFIVILRELIDQLGLSMAARIVLQSSGVDYIAATVLLLGLLSFVRDYQIRKMQRAGNAQYVALLKPFTTIVKLLLVTIIALIWADSAGYNMSTVLAGLGVGSLAVALAAQKTLENVIGAVTLYTARPVKAGDFCRFGKVTGTVEEIGLRSTIIRTLDRTLVVIPNSVFSSTEVENFTARDRIRYYRRMRLQMPGPEQLRYILAEVRKTLYAHPRVMQETVSVRFDNIEDGTAWLRLDGGVDTIDFQDFLGVAEDLNLRIVQIVHDAGAVFSGPGRLMVNADAAAGANASSAVESVLQEWRQQDSRPFPNHSAEEIGQLKNTLDYPPKGSRG